MTNKQRAYLSSLAAKEGALFQVGKGGISPELISAVDEALTKRELIKISVLKNCMDDIGQAASILAERTHSDVVRIIGRRIILYKRAKKPVIILPE